MAKRIRQYTSCEDAEEPDYKFEVNVHECAICGRECSGAYSVKIDLKVDDKLCTQHAIDLGLFVLRNVSKQ